MSDSLQPRELQCTRVPFPSLFPRICSNFGWDSKASTYNAGDPGSIPGSGRSPGEGNGNPLQYSCLKKSHGQRDLVGYGARVLKVTDMNECVCILALRSKIDICINIEILEKGNPEKCIMIRRWQMKVRCQNVNNTHSKYLINVFM